MVGDNGHDADGVSRRELLLASGAVGATALAGPPAAAQETTTGQGTTTADEQLDFGNGEINFNVSPSVAQERLQEQYQPIQEYLENEIGVPTSMQLANNYSAVIQALGSGTSDVAETGPFAAALGTEAGMAEIVLQRRGYGSWEYQSIIVAADEVDVSNMDELATYVENNETTIAFADRLSASGALFPLYDLKQAGVDIGNLPEGSGGQAAFNATFSNHTGAYQSVAAGQADFAGIGGFVPGQVENFEQNASVVHRHEGLPRAPIVVSPELTDAEQSALVDAFTGAPNRIYWGADGEEGTGDDLWFNAVREVDVEKYQPVIDAANALGVGTDYFGGS